MKGRVLVIIIIGSVLVGILVNTGVWNGHVVEIYCQYEKKDCKEKKYFMNVVSVNDSVAASLIGKNISPEVMFKQTRLNNYIQSRLNMNANPGFYLIGYLRSSSVNHCLDSKCFRVRKIKQASDASYTEF